MKVKTTLIVLAALFVAFKYPVLGMWLVPVVMSVFLLRKSGKYKISKYIGLLSLKPVFIWILLFLIAELGSFVRFSELNLLAFSVVPELILTIAIVYFFRGLFGSYKLTRIFLIADIVRWVVIFITFGLFPPVFEVYYSRSFYVGAFFFLVYPSLFAIAGFLYVSIFVRDESAADKKNISSPTM